jgi:hypothetical protein
MSKLEKYKLSVFFVIVVGKKLFLKKKLKYVVIYLTSLNVFLFDEPLKGSKA